MKISFLFELLLVFIIIAFGASKPLESDGRDIRYTDNEDNDLDYKDDPTSLERAPGDDDDDDDDFDLDDDDDDVEADEKQEPVQKPDNDSDADDDDDEDEKDDDDDDDDILGFDDDDDENKKDPASEEDSDGEEFVLFGEDFFDGLFGDDDDDRKKTTTTTTTAAPPAILPAITGNSVNAPVAAVNTQPQLSIDAMQILQSVMNATSNLARPENLVTTLPQLQTSSNPLKLQHSPALLSLAQNTLPSPAPVISAAATPATGSKNPLVIETVAQITEVVTDNIKPEDISSSEDSNEEGLIVVSDEKPTDAKKIQQAQASENEIEGSSLQNDKDMASLQQAAIAETSTPTTVKKPPKKDDDDILGIVESLISDEDDDDDLKVDDDSKEGNESQEAASSELDDEDNEAELDEDNESENNDSTTSNKDTKKNKKKKANGLIGSIGESLGLSRIFGTKN